MRVATAVFCVVAGLVAAFLVVDTLRSKDERVPSAKEHSPVNVPEEDPIRSGPPPRQILEVPEPSEEIAAEPEKKERDTDVAYELEAILEARFAQAGTNRRETFELARSVEELFAGANLQGKGQLQDVECRQGICQGTVEVANAEVDGEVFRDTFLSAEYRKVGLPFAITSRTTESDGSVRATFYIYEDSVHSELTTSASSAN